MKRTSKLFLAAACLVGLAGTAPAQIVVNEVSVTAPEFIELLVLSTGNYENYSVVDGLQSGGVGAGGFKLVGSGWQNLAAGTIVVLWNQNTAGDTDEFHDLSYNPGGGDYVLQLDRLSSPNGAADTFGLIVDTSMILGSVGEVVLVGTGGDYDTPPFPTSTIAGAPTSSYYDIANFRFGLASGSPQEGHSTLDVDLTPPMDYFANGSSFTSSSDYSPIVSTTPGEANSPENLTYINGLRGIADDDPDIFVPVSDAILDLAPPAGSVQMDIEIQSTGNTLPLTVAGSTFSGGDAGKFSIVSQPAGVAGGTTATLTIQFTPGGTAGVFSSTLNINSNDSGGDVPTVEVKGVSGATADYAGLYIDEIHTFTTSDEFIEIINTTAAAMDISGVIVADEDMALNEGAIAFPSGTTIAAGERIVIALGTSDTEPTWLDSVPAGVQVFYEPARDPLAAPAWAAANGNTLTAMDDWDSSLGGPSGTVFLADSDNLALLVPYTQFDASGIFDFSACIDGVNLGTDSTNDPGPINPAGDTDIPATRAAVAGAAGISVYRIAYTTNTSSIDSFGVSQAFSPGSSTALAASPAWNLLK